MINLWPLLLPAAAWSGWWVAQKKPHCPDKLKDNRFSREYVVGLNYLLNEQPDKAVDHFIKLLEVDTETVETHLALGGLFRRRGEVDRAIRIHQNLIARPELSDFQRKEALMALAQDYMSAGVYDRAERIFLEVIDLVGPHKDSRGLKGLLAIYQQEKSWETALDILKKLEVATNQSLHVQAAHYYCEIATQAMNDKSYEKAHYSLKQALLIDKSSVRASLLLSKLETLQGRHAQSIKALKKVAEQDPAYLSEMIQPLYYNYEALDARSEYITYLKELLNQYPSTAIILVIGDYIKEEKGVDAAIDFVYTELSQLPSMKGINKIIFWHLESAYGKVRDKLQMLYDITNNFLENKPFYRCGQCGFSGRHLHWLCPSCKQWGKIKPINGIEGG